VPCLSKVAPAKSDVHMEDVHRAGGIMAILGELDRAGLLHTDLPTVHSRTLGDALNQWDIKRTNDPEVQSSSRPHRAACRRRPRSASRAAGTSSISTARTA
jgi:dihydroxyacid dehydratase/phosphogluconate dehydratase